MWIPRCWSSGKYREVVVSGYHPLALPRPGDYISESTQHGSLLYTVCLVTKRSHHTKKDCQQKVTVSRGKTFHSRLESEMNVFLSPKGFPERVVTKRSLSERKNLSLKAGKWKLLENWLQGLTILPFRRIFLHVPEMYAFSVHFENPGFMNLPQNLFEIARMPHLIFNWLECHGLPHFMSTRLECQIDVSKEIQK